MIIDANILAERALACYDMPFSNLEFIRENENLVFSVMSGKKRYVLRIRKPAEGFDAGDSDPIKSVADETAILHFLSLQASFPVQKPVAAKDGALFCLPGENAPAALLEWLEGEPIGSDPEGKYARDLGRLAAQIHKALRCLDISRPSYGRDRIAAMTEEVITAQKSGHISEKHGSICRAALSETDRVMEELDNIPGSKSLIHSDLGLGNVLITPDGLAPIDFSLSGHGYAAQECGMIATNYNNPAHWQEVCAGYEEISGVAIDPHHLDAFFAMSVLLFITAQHSRFWQDGWFTEAMDRWCSTCFKRVIEKRTSA